MYNIQGCGRKVLSPVCFSVADWGCSKANNCWHYLHILMALSTVILSCSAQEEGQEGGRAKVASYRSGRV